jgi:hypothetical protein
LNIAENRATRFAFEGENGSIKSAREPIPGRMLDENRLEDSLRNIDMCARTGSIVVALGKSAWACLRMIGPRTARWGSFPHEYILANSSPAILLHQRVCCIESPLTATFLHSSSRPMSRRHSNAAIFVMWARGVSAVLGVAASMMPFNPDLQH